MGVEARVVAKAQEDGHIYHNLYRHKVLNLVELNQKMSAVYQ